MALALRFEKLVQSGAVTDYATLATLGHVSRARVTQIMNLLCLEPDIQEVILFLPKTESGRDPIILAQLLPIAALMDWRKQRDRWQLLQRGTSQTSCDQCCLHFIFCMKISSLLFAARDHIQRRLSDVKMPLGD